MICHVTLLSNRQ